MNQILFNTEDVRATLDGRKTCTRRVVKPQPICYGPNVTFAPHDVDFFLSAEKQWLRCRTCGNDPEYSREGSEISHHWEPPYRPGDILYVREAFAKISDWVDVDPEVGLLDGYFYRADWDDGEEHPNWHPSIHMPKEAARLFLRVTNVRVERLQDITSADCEKEGVDPTDLENLGVGVINHETYTQEFQTLWNSTIKITDIHLYGWDANPWVWVIEFERISRDEAIKRRQIK